jgi:kynurenine formamidase
MPSNLVHAGRLAVAAGVLTGSLSAQDGMTRAQFDALFTQVNNAGRWGAEDERGTLNLITEEVRREAAREVRQGVSVSLARELVPGPIPAAEPMELEFVRVPDSQLGPADDSVSWTAERFRLLYHGWGFTHVDALSHMSYHGRAYNDEALRRHPDGSPVRNAVRQMRDGIVSRGVLVDVPRLRGVPYLEGRAVITVQDLERWEQHAGVRVRSGDVLLIRTGRWARQAALGPAPEGDPSPGIDPRVAAWLHARGVAALGDDGGKDPSPSPVPGLNAPLHALTLVAMGMPLFDNLDLEAVARQAAERSRWTFFFVAAPLEIRGATGSPLNPLAVF